jgi:hypothetical protein
MAILTGKNGAVEKGAVTVPTVRQWQVTTSADAPSYAASNTKGGTSRIDGNKDWSGSYQAYGALPAVTPGESFVFHGSINTVNGVTGACLCNQIEITWDIEAGTPISHTVSFEANGALTIGAETAADATIPDPPTSKGTKASMWSLIDIPAETAITDIRTMTLTFTSANQSYKTSTTNGQTERVAGILDWTASITVYEDDFDDLPDVNDIVELRMFADSTLYWQLKYAIVTEVTDLEVAIESGDKIGATINFAMVGFTDAGTSPVPTEGVIKTPESSPTTWWPV